MDNSYETYDMFGNKFILEVVNVSYTYDNITGRKVLYNIFILGDNKKTKALLSIKSFGSLRQLKKYTLIRKFEDIIPLNKNTTDFIVKRRLASCKNIYEKVENCMRAMKNAAAVEDD